MFFQKWGAEGDFFAVFCKFDGFYEKTGKKTPRKGGVFSGAYTGKACELSTRHLRRSAAKLGSTVLCFLRFFTAFRMRIGRARRLASTHTFCFLSQGNIYRCKLKFTRKSSIFICNRQQELFRRRFNNAASNASTAPSSFKSAAAICSSVNSTAPTDASTSNE